MNRTLFLLTHFLILPIIVAGTAAFLPEKIRMEFFGKYVMWTILIVFPLSSFLRMRYLKYTEKEMLKSIVPFWGEKLKWRQFSDK